MVITKDLSRLGRDYIDTGRYVERYFPENNVRYIAINDDIDTFYETSSSDMMPFKLSMNDMYTKDISKKVRSHLLIMKKEGKFCGSSAPYGYRRCKEDKHKLEPDPNTAPVVKRIFDLYVSGYSSSSIADILTKEEIPTPIIVQNFQKKIERADHPEIWKQSSVSDIIKNRVYIGDLIQHTSQNINHKCKKRRKVPKNKWCIVENSHEPIIDKETFELAGTIKNKSNNYSPDRRNVDYKLSSLVYCKDCGARMSISYDKKRDRISMNCNNYRKFSKYGFCFSHYINYKKLEKTIYSNISELSLKYLEDKEEFEKILKQNFLDPKEELQNKIEKEENEIKNLKLKQDSLYDDKFNNVITKDTYKRLFEKTESEIKKLSKKLEEDKYNLTTMKENKEAREENTKIILEYLSMKNPTKEMLNKIIEKIYIDKDKNVEIHYRIKKIPINN